MLTESMTEEKQDKLRDVLGMGPYAVDFRLNEPRIDNSFQQAKLGDLIQVNEGP